MTQGEIRLHEIETTYNFTRLIYFLKKKKEKTFETTCSFASHTVISSAVLFFFFMFLKFLFTNLNVSLCMQYRDDRLCFSSSTHRKKKGATHKKKIIRKNKKQNKGQKQILPKVLMNLLEKISLGGKPQHEAMMHTVCGCIVQ